tara:strand:- start:1347 stop:1949 length:603 start_codon:yes stop_codon:yes gene_type:complete
MTIPSSGALRFVGIFSELNEDDYTAFNSDGESFSLKDMSTGVHGTINLSNMNANKPDNTAPHAASEFYAYDHENSMGSSPLSLGTVSYNNSSTSTITVTHAEHSDWWVNSKPSWVSITSGNYGSGNADQGPGSVTLTTSTNSSTSSRSGSIIVAFSVGGYAAAANAVNGASTRTTSIAQAGAPSGPPGVPPGGNGRGFNP